MRRWLGWLVLPGLVAPLAFAVTKRPGKAPAPDPQGPQRLVGEGRGDLPAAARELLVSRMRTHKVDTNQLLQAVLLLDRVEAARLASNLAGETQLARPTPGEHDELNGLVPGHFFDLQERLVAQARGVAIAARAGDDVALGTAFAALVETCVACHAAYLQPTSTLEKR